MFAAAAEPLPPVITRATASPPDNGGAPGTTATNYSGQSVPGGQATTTKTDSPPESESACGSFCLGVLAFIALLAILGAACWEAIGADEDCEFWDKYVKKYFQDAGGHQLTQEEMDAMVAQGQGSALTAEQIVVVAGGSHQVNEMVMTLFRLQVSVWSSLAKARAFLATCGLAYPDANLAFPLHQQFLTTPPVASSPRRPEADPVRESHHFPTTPPENPAGPAALYPVGATPDVILTTGQVTISATALQTWRQIARGDEDARNFDLDADRWGGHSCWATDGSIQDDPVGVVSLGYEDM